jgi:hypothetical protein
MKGILMNLILNLMVLFSFAQTKTNDLTILANTGTVLFSGGGFYPGIGAGLQLSYGKENRAFTMNGAYTYFPAKYDRFNRFDRGWITLMPGFIVYSKQRLYLQGQGGGVLETGVNGVEGYGVIAGIGVGYKPKAGNGYIDIFAKINFMQGALTSVSYTIFGLGYAIPFSKGK